MLISAIKTRTFLPPQDNIFDSLLEKYTKITPKSILVITSKVVAIHQGRCVSKSQIDKDTLIHQQASWYLPRDKTPGRYGILTLTKEYGLIVNAGVDGQNSNGYYILPPINSDEFCKHVHQLLSTKIGFDNFGVLVIDSHTMPFRRGALGMAVGSFGFERVKSNKKTPDIFGKLPSYGLVNVADSLASSATLVLGESNEQSPFGIISDLDMVEFNLNDSKEDNPKMSWRVDREQDIYSYLFKGSDWHKGGE